MSDTPEASSPSAPPSLPPGRDPAAERAAAERRLQADLKRIDDEIAEVENFRMPLLDHLKEIQWRLMWVGAALVVGSGIGLYFAKDMFAFLQAPLVQAMSMADGIEGGLSIVNSPFEGWLTWLKVGIFTGVFLSSPVISYHFWRFVAPGLYRSERRVVVPLTIASVVLFFAGGAFCYYVIFPYAFPFFIDVLGVNVNLSVSGYLTSVLQMIVAFGLCFELPVFIYFLARAGLVDHIDLLKGSRYAIVAIFIVAAVVTPPDVVTQTLLAVPMCLLYAVGIVIARSVTTKVRDSAPSSVD